MTRAELLFLLKKYRITPNNTRGQNFLIDDSVLHRIVSAARLAPTDVVLEIGAGIGNLTGALASKAQRVVSVEVDEKFKPVLEKITAVHNNISLVFEDIRRVPFEELRDHMNVQHDYSYSVVGNIPYYLTSHLITTLLREPLLPQTITMLVQKEVAERICSTEPRHTKLSLAVQFYGAPKQCGSIPASSFYPQPEVDSEILQIGNIQRWAHEEREDKVWRVIKFGFASKRKNILNNLSAGFRRERSFLLPALDKAGILPETRAEQFSKEQWLSLTRALDEAGSIFDA